ncbi:MAG: leucine-rich repeat protein [Lachnospiraceae bacterium]|nr:leucine-rich repeat protein [Lachnospiraceae bacterium]
MKLKNASRLLAFLLAVTVAFMPAHVYALTINPTNVNSAASGNVLIGVEGSFITDSLSAGIKRINEIREEAYNEGIVASYVPIKLSKELEAIAQLRAAEASLYRSHTRPNGKSCFSASVNGFDSYGEILAWNSSGLVAGINQWYSEKTYLVNNTGGETGHYEQMINPANKYIGLGCFYSRAGVSYPYSICGEFNRYSNNQTAISSTANVSGEVIQLIEVPLSEVSVKTQANITGNAGETKDFGLAVKYSNSVNAYIYDLTWTSSDKSVASVENNSLNLLSNGTAVLTTSFNGSSYSVNVSVGSNNSSNATTTAAKATTTAAKATTEKATTTAAKATTEKATTTAAKATTEKATTTAAKATTEKATTTVAKATTEKATTTAAKATTEKTTTTEKANSDNTTTVSDDDVFNDDDLDEEDEDLTFTYNGSEYAIDDESDSNEVILVEGANKSKVVIPDTVSYNGVVYKVTEIEDSAFAGHNKIKKVSIGKYVTDIGESAFKNCKKLKTLIIGASVDDVDDYAFFNCKKLKKITVKTENLDAYSLGVKSFGKICSKAAIYCPSSKLSKYKKYFKRAGAPKKVKYK